MEYLKIIVPRKVAEELEAPEHKRNLVALVKDYYSQQIASAQGVVDTFPADNGATKTQDMWIRYFNQQGKGMISAPDVYNAGKTGSEELIENLKNDFQRYWLVASTGIAYSPDTLDARIVHNRGSTVVQPTEKRVVVPIYENVLLKKVLETKEGVAYLQALFNTKDKPKMIAQALAALSGKEVNDIHFYTPNQRKRAVYPQREADFGFGGDGFRVYGDYRVGGYGGLSHGVSVKSAKPTRKK